MSHVVRPLIPPTYIFSIGMGWPIGSPDYRWFVRDAVGSPPEVASVAAALRLQQPLPWRHPLDIFVHPPDGVDLYYSMDSSGHLHYEGAYQYPR